MVSETGTGEGSVISPLLANVYLHYVFDLWAKRWRRREATGDLIVVRYADDIIAGFEHETDANRFRDAMRARLQEFSLSLHPEQTRLIEFGRHAAAGRARRGLGKPETFTFLGFTFVCGKSRRGRFLVERKTRRDRMRAKLRELKVEMRRRRHQPIPEQGKWLRQVVTGFFAYHAVRTNCRSLGAFRYHVTNLWRRTLRRRSQKDRTTWVRVTKLADDWLPRPRVLHPWPSQRFAGQALEVGAGCGNAARPDLCGGRSAMSVPTPIAVHGLVRAEARGMSRRRARILARSRGGRVRRRANHRGYSADLLLKGARTPSMPHFPNGPTRVLGSAL